MLPRVVAALLELRGYQNLFRNFLVRDLSVRYKGSLLGVFWSLLNPLLMLGIYTLVFSVFIRFPGENYPIYFMSGFLPWFFFSSALGMGAGTLVANGALIQKVWFPRALLPLSQTAANLVNLVIAFGVFLPFAIATGDVSVRGLVALVVVTAALFLFTAGLVVLTSVLMVDFRDTEFLVGIALQAWFFLTPIVYTLTDAPENARRWLRLNPLYPFVESYRDVFYRGSVPSAERLGACVAIGVVAFAACYAVFTRLEGGVAEEL